VGRKRHGDIAEMRCAEAEHAVGRIVIRRAPRFGCGSYGLARQVEEGGAVVFKRKSDRRVDSLPPTPARSARHLSPTNDGGEEAPAAMEGSFPLPFEGGEVASGASRSGGCLRELSVEKAHHVARRSRNLLNRIARLLQV